VIIRLAPIGSVQEIVMHIHDREHAEWIMEQTFWVLNATDEEKNTPQYKQAVRVRQAAIKFLCSRG
jgi:hypothetical protein